MLNTLTKGQPGGFALLAKHGRQHYSEIGKLGGRPKFRDTLPRLPQGNIKLEVKSVTADNLETLRLLWKQHQQGAA